MNARKLGLYSTAAVIGVGLAYLLAILPYNTIAPQEAAKAA
jgi:hypothetical protein